MGKITLATQHPGAADRYIHQRMVDAALMGELAGERGESFDQVLRRRESQVLRTAYRILGNWADAEDTAQELFLKLHRRGLDIPSEAAMGAWIYRVTVNLCLDRARSRKPGEELWDVPSGGLSAEASAIREQEKQRLMAALAKLPPKERAAIVLREIEGLSTAEVADILGSAEGTVRSQVSTALVRLRGILTRGKL